MSAVYSTVADTQLIVLTLSGLVTKTEALVVQDALLKDPALRPGTSLLVRTTDTRPDLSGQDIIDISRGTHALAKLGLRGFDNLTDSPRQRGGLHLQSNANMQVKRRPS